MQREAKQRGLDPKDEDKIKEVARQEMTSSIGKILYNLLYGDRHCYNKVTQVVRGCGLMAGVAGGGAVAGGVAMGVLGASVGSKGLMVIGGTSGWAFGGLFPAAQVAEFENEYIKIQNDVQSRLQAIEDNTPPSATETLDTLLNEASQ